MATSLNLTGLSQGTSYEFRVTALGDNVTYANSAASSTSTFATLTKLATPTTPTLTRTTSSITASWTAVSNATGYTIAYKLSSASTWTTKTTTSTSYTISGLTSGATYQVKIMATSTNAAYMDSDYSSIASAVVQTKLATPTGLGVTATTTSLTLSWTSVTNASGYTVYYKLSSSSSWTTATTTTNSYTKSSLSEGVTYQFKVVATSTNTNYTSSSESTVVSGTTKTTLSTPTGLSIARTTNSLTATWTAVSNASSYSIQYKLSTASTWTTKTSTTPSYTLSSLQEGKTYDFKVKAVGTGDYVDSAYCTSVSATTKVTLATPTGLAATNVLSTTATLSWNAVANATSYLLTISDTNGPITGYDNKSVSGTSINLTGLTATHQYNVALVATSTSADYVNSSAATLEFTTDTKLATPGAPTLTKTTNSITATWGAVSAADSYTVAYKKGSGSWTEVSVSGTSYTLSSLQEGATYTFKVMAVTTNEAYENSDYSATSSATTLITLDTPTGLAASNITNTTATLTWNSVEHASGYKVEYRIVGAASWTSQNVDA